MEAIYSFVALGAVAGAMVAFGLLRWSRVSKDPVAAVAASRQPFASPAINMSSIKVSGVGGLGLVAACFFVAMEVPEIRRSMIVAITLGVAFGVLLAWKRHHHPLPSSDASSGANTTLKIDE
jgi:hypothetical protein